MGARGDVRSLNNRPRMWHAVIAGILFAAGLIGAIGADCPPIMIRYEPANGGAIVIRACAVIVLVPNVAVRYEVDLRFALIPRLESSRHLLRHSLTSFQIWDHPGISGIGSTVVESSSLGWRAGASAALWQYCHRLRAALALIDPMAVLP